MPIKNNLTKKQRINLIKNRITANDNTTLRLKHVNSDFSEKFKDAVVVNKKPVVFQTGHHSNIESSYKLAQDLTQVGFDVWKIAIGEEYRKIMESNIFEIR